jgi:lipoic acid synthetase
VDRDDLPDQGASHIARTIEEIKISSPHLLLEALVGDFRGEEDLVRRVANSPLNVYAHNIETVERLSPAVRDRRASYRQSLKVLEFAKSVSEQRGMLTKSSIMLGLGEDSREVEQTLNDLRSSGVDVVTFGQYLQPTKYHMKLSRYVAPTEFEHWKSLAESLGFVYVASGPLVRSSYRAGEFYMKTILNKST